MSDFGPLLFYAVAAGGLVASLRWACGRETPPGPGRIALLFGLLVPFCCGAGGPVLLIGGPLTAAVASACRAGRPDAGPRVWRWGLAVLAAIGAADALTYHALTYRPYVA